jgi:hypothetical protein
VPGSLVMEAPDTVRFDVLLGSRVVTRTGSWRRERVRCQLFVPGKRQGTNGRDPISDSGGKALDGEIIPLTDGVISGDANPGGDFVVDFIVTRPG